MSRQLLFALAFLPFLCHAAPTVVEQAAYKATVNQDGTCHVEVPGGPNLDISFIQRWVKFQTPAQMSLIERHGPLPGPEGTTRFEFRYFWNGCAMEERLDFAADGFAVEYACSPSVEKDVAGFSLLVNHIFADSGTAYRLVGLRYFHDQPGVLEADIPSVGAKGRFSQLSLRRPDGLVADFSPRGDAWFALENGILITQNFAPDCSKQRYRPGEVYRVGFNCRFSR